MFHWKDFNDKFKGEGIYHLTFAVNNRVPLLGDLSTLDDDAQTPIIIPTQLGTIVRQEAERIHTLNPNIQIITKCLMPDHFHLLLWSHDANEGSIKMTARGFSQACSKAARRLHQQSNPRPSAPSSPTALPSPASLPSSPSSLPSPSPVSIPAQSNCANTNAPTPDYSCGNGANTLFSTPFIRTLSHAGQLRTMYSYIQQNPRRAWIKRTHPDLFKLRRNTQVADLTFSSLGNHWLLDWPVSQTVICSRSITPEALQQLERQILHNASQGAITYSAAISPGEQHIMRHVRESGYPMVILLKDGFPLSGTDHERYFKPGGIYFELCSQGKLLLLEPTPQSYSDPTIITATDDMLRRKSEEKHHSYTPIPHTSLRWKFMAQNVMLHRIVQE